MKILPILRDSLFFFRTHLLDIARLCLPLLLLEAIAFQLLDVYVAPVSLEEASTLDSGFLGYSMLLRIVLYPLYTAALILYIDTRSEGREVPLRDIMARAASLWLRLSPLILVISLAVVVGLLFFIVPGIWLMVHLAFAEYLLVLRGTSLGDSLRGSTRLARGNFMRIVACILAVQVPVWLLSGLLISLMPESSPVLDVVQNTFIGFLQLLTTVVLYRLYMLIERRQARAA